MPFVLHIALKEEWERALEEGVYTHPSLRDEGFIHCCTEAQLDTILDRYHPERRDVCVLHIDTAMLGERVVHEWSESLQDSYPHIYGDVPTEAVAAVTTP